MRYAGRRGGQRRKRGENSYWLSFADLMSALLLIFVLVLFSVLFQLLTRSDELAVTTAQLSIQQEQLQAQQITLEEKDRDLQASQASLTDKERQILLEQAKLLALEKENEDAQALLAQQQAELDQALSQLDEQQLQLSQQQTLLTDQQQKMSDQQKKLDDLVGVKTRIIGSLATALSEANVRVRVDSSTGSIALDSSVLFDVGSSDLKEGGMRMIDQFLPVYLSVLFSGDYRGNIGEIIVEGHTDTDGTYLYNSDLSTRRALAVMNYILADDYQMISPAIKEELKKIATATGRSFSHPIKAADGEIDKDASRRVEFKFRMQDEQMIEDMRSLLEAMP